MATWPARDPVLRAIVVAESSSGAVDQFLTDDAIANPWDGFKALAVDLLPAVEALAKCAFTDPFQCGIYRSKPNSVTRFLAKIYFSRQRRVRAIALVLAVVGMRSPRLCQAPTELTVVNLEQSLESFD